jgi:hypothetical protein
VPTTVNPPLWLLAHCCQIEMRMVVSPSLLFRLDLHELIADVRAAFIFKKLDESRKVGYFAQSQIGEDKLCVFSRDLIVYSVGRQMAVCFGIY